MIIAKQFLSPTAQELIRENPLALQAYNEICEAILSIITPPYPYFIINNSEKNCNGVTPIKDPCYEKLENRYLWYRDKPLAYLHEDMKKGGPINLYKEFSEYGDSEENFNVGVEFETGNIASAHRSINKLRVGITIKELDLAMLILPIKSLSFYLTDRVANYEELEPYFIIINDLPFIVIGFDADEYSPVVPLLPKGRDGMSKRSVRKWYKKDKRPMDGF